MARKGFIRDKADMKFLILFLLDSLSEPVSDDILLEAALADECVDYFNYSEAMGELVEGGFVARGSLVTITEEGRRNYKALGRVLPYAARRRAQDSAVRALSRARRESCISTSTVKAEGRENQFVTTLAMTDGRDEIVRLEMMTVSKEQGQELETRFKKHAEAVYNGILDALLKDYGE